MIPNRAEVLSRLLDCVFIALRGEHEANIDYCQDFVKAELELFHEVQKDADANPAFVEAYKKKREQVFKPLQEHPETGETIPSILLLTRDDGTIAAEDFWHSQIVALEGLKKTVDRFCRDE